MEEITAFEKLLLNPTFKSRVAGKKIFLYGFNETTKSILFWLSLHGIYVMGFVLENYQEEFRGLSYCNKNLYTGKDFIAVIDGVIVDVFSDNMEFLQNEFPGYSVALFQNPTQNPLIIYGAGYWGKKAWELLNRSGVPILAFCDNAISKHGTYYCDLPVLPISALREQPLDARVVIAIDKNNANDVAEDLRSKGVLVEFVFYGASLFMPLLHTALPSGKEFQLLPSGIRYLFRELHIRNKRLILFGTCKDVCKVAKDLSMFDIVPAYGVSNDGFVGNINQMQFYSVERLSLESTDHARVFVLPGARKDILQLISVKPSLDPNMFGYTSFPGVAAIQRLMLDTNMGNSRIYETGIPAYVIKPNCDKKTYLKIGILGNSTSDSQAFTEVSWPQYLVDFAHERGVDICVYNGAISSCNASMGLVKLARDMVHLHLDFLISYTGVTEWITNSTENYFVPTFLKGLFERLDCTLPEKYPDIHAKGVYMGKGVSSLAVHWLNQERMKYGICREFGIKFFSVLQPDVSTKNPQSKNDKEIRICYGIHEMDSLKVSMGELREAVKNANCPWLKDFSSVFDGTEGNVYMDYVHLYSFGNQILARKMFDLIIKDAD